MRNHTLSTVLPAALLGITLATSASNALGQQDATSRQSFSYQSTDGDGRSIELRIENGRVMTAKLDGKPIPADRVKKVADGYDLLDADGNVLKHVAVVQGSMVQGSMPPGSGMEDEAEVEERRVIVRGGSSAHAQSGSSSSSSGNGTRSESRASGGVRGNGRASADTNGAASRSDEQRRSEARSRARIAVGPDGQPLEVREGFPLTAPSRIGRPLDVRGMDPGVMAELPKSMIGAGLGSPDAALAHHLRIDPSKVTMVTSIVEGLPAQAAGIERFDLIVAVNGDGDASSDHLRRVLRDAEPGSKIALEIRRGGEVRKVDVTAVEFDGEKLEAAAIEVEGMPMLPTYSIDVNGDADGGGVMFFVGPDGEQREMRLPGLQGMPGGFDPSQMEEFERSMEEMSRRMEAWSRMQEQRMREFGGEAGPRGGAPNRDDSARDNDRNNDRNDERMRRLEERLDQLMRELERERAENRERRKDA